MTAKLWTPNQRGIKVLTYLHFLLPEFCIYLNAIVLKVGSGLTSDENYNTLREGLVSGVIGEQNMGKM